MVEYTWVVNLLKEVEDFATENKFTSLSISIANACAVLISETEGKAEIRPEARRWLKTVAGRKI